jgi:hypothetical protein
MRRKRQHIGEFNIMGNMKFQFKQHISKAKYEHKLMTLVEEKSGLDPTKHVYKSKHVEQDGTVVWLYYDNRTDKHIGSWCKGQGWAYDFDGNGNVEYYESKAA